MKICGGICRVNLVIDLFPPKYCMCAKLVSNCVVLIQWKTHWFLVYGKVEFKFTFKTEWLFVWRCNLAPVEQYYQDVGWRTNLVTMNPSVVQRAFQDLVSEEWKDRFLQRLQSLSGSVLWIPAFMAKGGEERVEWALRLILLHTVDVRTAFPSLRLLHAVRG